LQKKFETIGETLLIASLFLFAVSIPTSIALDGVAAGLGILGYLILLVCKKLKGIPPLKPLLFLLAPELVTAVLKFPGKILKTDFNHKLAPYFVAYEAMERKKNLFKKVLFVLGLSSIVLSLSVIFEAFTWQNVKHVNWHSLAFHANAVRAKGLLDNPLTTAGVIFLLFFLFLSLFLQMGNYYYFVVAILLFLALIFTGSRSYWVGSAVSFITVFLLLFKERKHRKKLPLVLGLLALFSVSLYKIPFVKFRLESIVNTKNDWSNLDRLALWKAHVKAYINDYSVPEKLIGAGYKASSYAWKRFRESYEEILNGNPPKDLKSHFHGGLTHNIYLKFLTKHGILGLLGYLAFWFTVIYKNVKALNSEHRFKMLTAALTAGYAGFLTAGFFENNFTDAEIKYALMFVLALNFFLLKEGTVRPLSNKG